MALATEIYTQFNSGSIAIKDGTGTPLSVTVQFDQATFGLSSIKEKLRETSTYEVRGALTTVRHTSRIYPTGSFTCMVGEFTESAAGTVLDMIHGESGTPYSARVSTRNLKGDVMTFDIVLTIEGSDYGGADGTLTLNDCELVWDYAQSDPDTLSFSFTMYGALGGDLTVAEG